MNIAYIGLGSNIEPREEFLEKAIEALREDKDIEVTQVSSIYETEPVGLSDQGLFLNMAIEVETDLTHIDLLRHCQKIEKELGRLAEEDRIKNGPRKIDLDILLFNNEYRDLGVLKIPHPHMHERAFVMVPLAEIAPDRILPTSGKSVLEIAERLPKKELKEVKKWE